MVPSTIPVPPIKEAITSYLQPLIGLTLSIARRAADMRGFHFGEIRSVERGTVGEFAIHIQCPWRLEDSMGVLTGSSDLWEPIEENDDLDRDAWDYHKDGNLQDKRLGELLGVFDLLKPYCVNRSDRWIVESVQGDPCGGAQIYFSGGFCLNIFPCGIRGEDWRFFQPFSDHPHVVVGNGRIDLV